MTKQFLTDGAEFTACGLRFIVNIEQDEDSSAPWDKEDGHGPVGEWTSRDKKPGEWVLSGERGSKRFYDAAEAMRIAHKDGWGLAEKYISELTAKHGRTPTKGEITAEAVRRDFEYLRGWCNDEWHYVGVCVRHATQDADARYSNALWGIESLSDEYISEVAHQLAGECAQDYVIPEIKAQRETLKIIRQRVKELAADLRNGHVLPDSICRAVREKIGLLLAGRSAAHARIAELTA